MFLYRLLWNAFKGSWLQVFQNLVLREADELAVLQLRSNKYLSWDWNTGKLLLFPSVTNVHFLEGV